MTRFKQNFKACRFKNTVEAQTPLNIDRASFAISKQSRLDQQSQITHTLAIPAICFHEKKTLSKIGLIQKSSLNMYFIWRDKDKYLL